MTDEIQSLVYKVHCLERLNQAAELKSDLQAFSNRVDELMKENDLYKCVVCKQVYKSWSVDILEDGDAVCVCCPTEALNEIKNRG